MSRTRPHLALLLAGLHASLLPAEAAGGAKPSPYDEALNASPPRRQVLAIESTVAGIPSRPVTVLLPSGYDIHVGRRYPVIYFLDGQNVFSPGGPFGSWDADLTAAREIAEGRVRELILVTIPNGNAYGSDRLNEYAPTGDTVGPYLGKHYTGRGADFARFLIEDVVAAVDAQFRTLTDPAHRAIAGSSMGGLAADYISTLHSDRFGVAGIFSPAYWAAPKWVEARDAGPRLPVRRYLYMGTAESSTGEASSRIYWEGALRAYQKYQRDGYTVGTDLLFEGGEGAVHNEAAWARRVGSFLRFAYPAR